MPWYFATHDGVSLPRLRSKDGCRRTVLLAAGSGRCVTVAERGQRWRRRRTRAAKIDHGDGGHPPRQRRRERVRGGRRAVPDDVRSIVAAHRAHLWSQRLGLQLRAKHGGDNPAGYRVHRRAFAQRRCRGLSLSSTVAGATVRQRGRTWASWRTESSSARHGQGSGSGRWRRRSDASPCAVVAGRAVWGEEGPGS